MRPIEERSSAVTAWKRANFIHVMWFAIVLRYEKKRLQHLWDKSDVLLRQSISAPCHVGCDIEPLSVTQRLARLVYDKDQIPELCIEEDHHRLTTYAKEKDVHSHEEI